MWHWFCAVLLDDLNGDIVVILYLFIDARNRESSSKNAYDPSVLLIVY